MQSIIYSVFKQKYSTLGRGINSGWKISHTNIYTYINFIHITKLLASHHYVCSIIEVLHLENACVVSGLTEIRSYAHPEMREEWMDYSCTAFLCTPITTTTKKKSSTVITVRINLLQTPAPTRCAGRPMKCSFHYH